MSGDIMEKLEAAKQLLHEARELVKRDMPDEAYRRDGLGNRLASVICRLHEIEFDLVEGAVAG